jgi:uncharacterized phage protein (predicted DNA packaging)
MTESVSLAAAKTYLRLDPSDTSEDEDLADLIASSARFCEMGMGKRAADLPEEDLPLFARAVKLTIGHWYQNRESVSVGVGTNVDVVPDTARDILVLLGGVSFA